jgi:hypothetical protein
MLTASLVEIEVIAASKLCRSLRMLCQVVKDLRAVNPVKR